MPKISKPPKQCIFCGGTPMSKEHLFAAWMRDYLPPGQGYQHVGDGSFETRTIDIGPGPLNVKGDARSQKRRVVCKACNNEWMSGLQDRAKPILLPLLTGDEHVVRSSDAEIVAVWATMLAFVYETTARNYPILPNFERATFVKSKSPPKYWRYWCGPFDGETSPLFHRGVYFPEANLSPEVYAETQGDEPRVHLTFVGVGKICFAILGTNFLHGSRVYGGLFSIFITKAGIMSSPTSLGRPTGLVQLWPAHGNDINLNALRTSPLTATDLRSIGDEAFIALDRAYAATTK